MKKILISISIILVILISNVFGQPPAGTTNYEPGLDKFIGTWKWNDGNGNEVILKLKKVMCHTNGTTNGVDNGGYYMERLLGCHKYVHNGIVVEDNLSLYPDLTQIQKGSSMLSLATPNRIRGLFKDASLNKYENIRLTYNDVLPAPTLTWQLYNKESTYLSGVDPVPNNNTTLPKNLILIKQP